MPLRLCAVLVAVVASAPAIAGPLLDVEVDARDLRRRLLHAEIRIPCEPGPLKLWYPKWIPGTHGAEGPLQNVGGLKLQTADGTTVPWQRDDVELFRVHCVVPAGSQHVIAKLDYICNEPAVLASGHLSYGNASVGVLNWNTCLLYPDGPSCSDTRVRLKLRLPDKWKFATALTTEGESGGVITFKDGPLVDVIDCPLIAGEHLRTIKLATGAAPPALFHVVSESPGALELPPKVIDMYSRVVTEAWALFGSAPHREYQFLVTCSNDLGYLGLEHLTSSINGVRERDLIEDRNRKGWVANLIPHEYVHAWCGKYRRPAAMVTSNFHSPQKTKLLWVYEGLAEYLGELLMVRSGLITPEEYRERLGETIGTLTHRVGRRWRSLEDTAVAGSMLRGGSPHWNELRREQDFYYEGMLVWLEVDTLIRERSGGKSSLDDFCRRFFKSTTGGERVVPFELSEIVGILNDLAEYDWATYFARRVSAPLEALPLEFVPRLGYRLAYAAKPSAYLERQQEGPRGSGFVTARDSLGLVFSNEGRVTNVIPGLAGDTAGLAPGVQVAGVNGHKFSRQRLHDALAASVATKKVELLLVEADRFRTLTIDYDGGPKYVELVRDDQRPDVLADILKPLTKEK
jgi:predicted metalloprotease with PDZ domain